MMPFEGDTVFPLKGTPYSILTEYCESSSMTRFASVTEVGAALVMSMPILKNGHGEFPVETFVFAESLEEAFTETFVHTSFKGVRSEKRETVEEVDDALGRENLQYFKQMIAGVWAHLSVNFGSHEETLERGFSIDEEYASAFDADDFEMGSMFDC
jgi:hypothetical protein